MTNAKPADAAGRRRFRMVIPSYATFNIYSGIARITTALGPVSVATVVNKTEGWDAEVIDENNYRRYGPVDANGKPDHRALQAQRPATVVGFYGGLSSTVPRLYELARLYKSFGVATIAGGQHFVGNNIAEALRNGVDYIVLGEGEETIKEVLTALESGQDMRQIRGIAFLIDGVPFQTEPRELMTDFGKLPIPDFSLVRYAKISLYPVNWVRGCSMNCEFCTVKGKARESAPERVMEQVASLVEKHDARHFFVVDDLFGQNRLEALRLCKMLSDYQKAIKTRLDITVQIRLDKSKDAELLTAMREAGINTLAIGFESPILEELQAMNKKLKPADMIAMARTYREAGFLVHGMFIFGYPMSPGIEFQMSAKERIKRFRRFIRDARIDTIQVLLPGPLPGTGLTERLQQQNRIYPNEVVGWEYYDGNFPLFEPDAPLTAEEMQASIQKIMGRFYRFKHMFSIGLDVLWFPAMVFYLHNLKAGWRVWYREWRNDVMKFGGWLILRNWLAEFKKGIFPKKLKQAKELLARQNRKPDGSGALPHAG